MLRKGLARCGRNSIASCAFGRSLSTTARSASTGAPVPIATVDAFATDYYSGNPAAVCLLPSNAKPLHGPDAREFDDWMRSVAEEMKLSETAFLRPMKGDNNNFELRWWTPTVEVDLCGHATMASSHALLSVFGAATPTQDITFHTLSGELLARRLNEDEIEMDFPEEGSHGKVDLDHEHIALVAQGLGIEQHQIVAAERNRMDLLVELDSEATLSSIPWYPDFGVLAQTENRVLIVTAKSEDSDGDFDIATRFFAPAFGVNEDPVCGSAHCFLGPYWTPRFGRPTLNSRAACERGGAARVGVGKAGGASQDGRVKLVGRTVTTLSGNLVGGLPDHLFQS
mgnify:CR=1 FL=1